MPTESKEPLQAIRELGTAKIAGLVCNKKAPVTLRLDLEVPVERLESVLDALGLEPTPELMGSLEAALKGLRKSARRP